MIAEKIENHLKELHSKDELAWLSENVRLLKSYQPHKIDFENLAEYLEEEIQRHKLDSYRRVRKIIQLLLKFKYQKKTHKFRKLDSQLFHLRFELEFDLKHSDTIRQYIIENLPSIYQDARDLVIRQTEGAIPETCPFYLEQIINEDFVPTFNYEQK